MENRFFRWLTVSHAAILIAILAFIAYIPVFTNDFVDFDDDLLITENPIVTELSLKTIRQAFTSYDPELYIPLTLLTFQVEHAFFELNPAVFHTTNLLLHIATAIFFLLIVLHLTKRVDLALLSALLFVLHPIHTEAVAWASARKDVLSGMFALACGYSFLRFRSTEQKVWYYWSLAAFLCALLAKVTVLFVPVVLMLFDWAERRPLRESIKTVAPLFALSFVFGVVALLGKQQNVSALSVVNYILLAIKNSGFSLQHLVAPYQFSVLYPQELPILLTSSDFLIPLCFAILLCAIGLIAFCKQQRMIVLCIVGFFLFLAPTFLTVWKNGFLFFTSDRYVYIASMFLFVLIAACIHRCCKRNDSAFIGLSGVLTLLLVVLTFNQVRVWHSTNTLFRHALALYPQSALAHNNVGAELLDTGNPDEAIPFFETARSLDASYIKPLENLAAIERMQGNNMQADALLEQAIAILDAKERPSIGELQVYYLLGSRFDRLGKREEAIALFEQAAEKGDLFAQSHFNLGVMYHKYGRLADATRALERAVALDSSIVQAQYQLAAVYSEQGLNADAVQTLRKVLKLAPNHPQAQHHLEQLQRRL